MMEYCRRIIADSAEFSPNEEPTRADEIAESRGPKQPKLPRPK
jgi:hypothetical protein